MSLKLILTLTGLGLGALLAGTVAYFFLWRVESWGDLAGAELICGGLLLLYALFRSWRDRRWRRRELGWREVDAVVTASGTTRAFPWGGGSTKYWQPDVRYRFSLDGVEHEGRRVQMDPGSNTDEAEVIEWAARYPVGAAVTARCDPKDPRRAVLELDDDGSALALLGFATLPPFVVFAGVFALVEHLTR